MSNVWFITGTSTGFGRDLAVAALENGDRVAATARKPEVLGDLTEKYGDKVLALRLDVTKPDEISAAVEATVAAFGRIDVLVNNAGYAQMGAIEEVTDAQFRQQYDTNVFGLLNVTRAVLPVLRQQKAGRILNISSAAGLVGFPATGAYASSKFAVEGITEALAQEVEPLGIRVTLIEPGLFRTAISSGELKIGENRQSDYDPITTGVVEWIQNVAGNQPGDPKKAAQIMVDLVSNPNPPLRLLLGRDALDAARQKLASLQADFDANEAITTSTDFPDL